MVKTDISAASKSHVGFWMYLMTDCIVFASLFATYIVLKDGVAAGPSGDEIFDLPLVLVETMLLLTSSFTAGLALLSARVAHKRQTLIWLAVTLLLGLAFLGLEIGEFTKLLSEGHSWRESAFLSAFFTLVGTHGLHIAVGLIWGGTMLWRVKQDGLKDSHVGRLTLFSLYWHFLDIIWIMIFSVVYLMGVIKV